MGASRSKYNTIQTEKTDTESKGKAGLTFWIQPLDFRLRGPVQNHPVPAGFPPNPHHITSKKKKKNIKTKEISPTKGPLEHAQTAGHHPCTASEERATTEIRTTALSFHSERSCSTKDPTSTSFRLCPRLDLEHPDRTQHSDMTVLSGVDPL